MQWNNSSQTIKYDLQNEDNLKNYDDIKNEGNLKNEDNLKKKFDPPPLKELSEIFPFF